MIVTFSGNTALADGINCQSIGETAKLVMWHRQNGTAISRIMGVVDRSADSDLRKLMKAIVVEAYETPFYSSQLNKEEIISEFGNKIEVICIKSSLE